MKICPVCHAQLNDDVAFCTQCGAPQGNAATASEPAAGAASASGPEANTNANTSSNVYGTAPNSYVPPFDPFDHTGEYKAKDISDNKVMAMAPYLLGWIGIIVALLAARESPFASFHVHQALKIEITEALLLIISVVLCFTLIIPFACAVCIIILFVLRVIAFFQIASGKAKEPGIIRSLGFLR